MKRIWWLAVLALVAGACGSGSGSESSTATDAGGEERKVLIDYRHDVFTSAFLRYYPEKVKVRPGDTVRFEQTWTGEPHSVTMGKVVDMMITGGERFQKYNSEEEALAGGETPEAIAEFLASGAKVPGMTNYGGHELYQPGAQPCYVEDVDQVPLWSDPATEKVDPEAICPTKGQEQPAFTGRQGFYNSGFIPAEGEHANTFLLPIAADATPGTYKFFCNYHWVSMSGEVEVVEKATTIPSQLEVSRQARKEIDVDAAMALERVKEAKAAKAKLDDLTLPLAGRAAGEESAVVINEFLPNKVTAKAGEKVTWTFDGTTHTVSFNVPKYFPIFSVAKAGDVSWNPKSFEPVAWKVPPRPETPEGSDREQKPEPRVVDVGTWDGKGGFHSSGALDPGESFTVAFSKPGTYSFACVLHPQMVGSLVVKA